VIIGKAVVLRQRGIPRKYFLLSVMTSWTSSVLLAGRCWWISYDNSAPSKPTAPSATIAGDTLPHSGTSLTFRYEKRRRAT
jgi:hypothetical protein